MNQLKNYLTGVKAVARTASPNGRDYKHNGNFTPLTAWNGEQFNYSPILNQKEHEENETEK
jgi:hypothetical protein